MKLKDELASSRYNIMRLRARGISTKPQNYLHDEVKKLQNFRKLTSQGKFQSLDHHILRSEQKLFL